MMRLKNLRSVQRLLPGAATLLTLSLAITLRVERSCSDQPHVDTQPTLHLPYPYPEMFAIYGPEKPTGTPPGAHHCDRHALTVAYKPARSRLALSPGKLRLTVDRHRMCRRQRD